MLTQERLKELLHYDQKTGVFTWRDARNGRVKIGSIAGTVQKKGYRQIEIDGKGHKESRLAWLYMTGEWPPEQVDHEDTNRANNAWSNLRLATNKTNAQNKRKAQSNNATGVLGVGQRPSRGGFRARITVDGKTINLGRFNTEEAAHVAYVQAKRSMHEGCTL